ncbi:MAG TPA: gamma-glutamyltransferase [Gammaproteobacteria bacterium]|nr:gamma-glutamyltransferase [Gammaproteobacteria bacterium]
MRFIALIVLFISFPVFAASTEAVYGSNGMVASRSTLASEAGIEIMRQGGNAVDAAVATAFALAVTYPSAGNLGGGGFAVLRLQSGEVVTLDHREKAPAAAHRDMFLDENGEVDNHLARSTLLSSGVPGSVDGLITLLQRYGTLSLPQVIAPAIKLARDGFEIDWYVARHFARVRPKMIKHAASIAKFSVAGRPPKQGDIWRQPDLASTLQRISDEGRKGFYEGKTADLIVSEMQRSGGIISYEDLADYRSVWREPVKGSYRGYDIWSMGPPSSGGALLIQILNMLENHDLSLAGWGSADAIHLMVEAERRAYADRAKHLGDPDFFPVPIATLIDKAYAKARFGNVNLRRASDSDEIYPGAMPPAEGLETTHFSVLDKDGLMVALTTTLNSSYGNKIVVPGTGMLLNNEMDDFSAKPNTENQFQLLGAEANAIAPNKRMLSSMTPTLVTRQGKPFLITGSPGGSTIITTTLQVILNIIDHGMSIEDAVSVPRFHHQWKPDRILYERFAFSPDTIRELQARGHNNLTEANWGRGIGDANSILFKDGVMQGVKDPRAEGMAVGF